MIRSSLIGAEGRGGVRHERRPDDDLPELPELAGLPPAAVERVRHQRASGVRGSLLSAPAAAADPQRRARTRRRGVRLHRRRVRLVGRRLRLRVRLEHDLPRRRPGGRVGRVVAAASPAPSAAASPGARAPTRAGRASGRRPSAAVRAGGASGYGTVVHARRRQRRHGGEPVRVGPLEGRGRRARARRGPPPDARGGARARRGRRPRHHPVGDPAGRRASRSTRRSAPPSGTSTRRSPGAPAPPRGRRP